MASCAALPGVRLRGGWGAVGDDEQAAMIETRRANVIRRARAMSCSGCRERHEYRLTSVRTDTPWGSAIHL